MTTPDPYLTNHFHPLHLASAQILAALRADESSPNGDLYRRLVSSSSVNGGAGSNRYHFSVEGGEGGRVDKITGNGTGNDDGKEVAPPSNHLMHSHSIPLPPPISAAISASRQSHSMGLFSPANLVWVACDSTLYLWRHGSSSGSAKGDGYESDAAAGGSGGQWGGVPSLKRVEEDVCSFKVGGGQGIVGVGLVRPKKGVFKPTIQWCIIVTTPSEVILCALDHSDTSMLRLIPTRFILPTDNVPMISIRGTKDGRIFLGGLDGCLYEMCYEGPEKKKMNSKEAIEAAIEDYFDGEGMLRVDTGKSGAGAILSGGKRVLSALTFGSLDGDSSDQYRRRKCRKINHSSVSPSISSVVPGVVVRAAAGMFGSAVEAAARKGGPIVSMVLDEERLCLYTLGASGVICAYDMIETLSGKGNTPPRLACVLDSIATAKLYLDSVSRGRVNPPVTTQSVDLGNITFAGQSNCAQAGVGGMEGAREILKRHDRELLAGNTARASNLRELANSAGILHPVSIDLIAGEDSKTLTLMAVTGGGLRYFLSSLTSTYGLDYSARGVDSKRNRPGKKMTLYHIRAPPPYATNDGNDGLKIEAAPSALSLLRPGSGGGIPPGIHNVPTPAGASSDNRRGDVVKSYCGNGVFVIALDVEKGNKRADSTGNRDFFSTTGDERKSSKGPSNAVIVALPDYAARVTESTSNAANAALTVYSGTNTPSRSPCGGISEIAIMPMSGIGGTSSPVLPGGTTFDISSEDNRNSSVIGLFMNSETPSDLELQLGLMPAYIPPKKKPRTFNSPGAASALVVPNGSGRGVVSSALTTLSNYLRSGQGAGYTVGAVSGSIGGFQPPSTYRISRRHGCDLAGFSKSSAEVAVSPRTGTRATTSPPRSATAKSARLPSWLTSPAAAPMDLQSSMHLTTPGSSSLLILNAGGLHVFTNSSLLNNLASVLLRASNIARDDTVRAFFTSYGYAEGCAMCFALATSGSSNSNLRERAVQAALTHARRPSMKLISTGDGIDPLSGYKFEPSCLYEGLVKFSSRLLRPFWHKAAVVCTEAQPIPKSTQSVYFNYYAAVPAKVELLLDDITLDEIRRPLMLLQALMKKTFDPVVNSVPGTSKQSADSMDVDEDMNLGGQITRALQSQARAAQQINNSNQPHDLTPDELRKKACQQEDRNMHSLYRLWSRCVQMLNLMACLKRAHSSPALPDVQWGLVHGLTFCQLVTSFEGQQRIETLLNALFSQSDNSLVSELSTEGDALADMLSQQCYLFFSSASRLTYLGFKSAREALSKSPVSSQHKLLSNKAASYLRAAARHWHDPATVVGRLSTKNSDSSWKDIARMAIEGESPLALAADELIKLENAEGLADVCLICASNFGGAKVQRDDSKELGEAPVTGMFDWEKGLYHQPPHEQPTDTTNSQPSSSQSIVSGVQATKDDALKVCHSIMFHHISKLLGSGGAVNERLAEEIVRTCASSSDVKFLHAFYEQLVATNNVDTLLRIDSVTLENWLKEKNDVNLLYNYYSSHQRYVLAGGSMWNLAVDDTQMIPIGRRIEYLTRAANAYSATSGNALASEQVSSSEIESTIRQIEEQLDVAKIQDDVLNTVQRSENTNLSSEKMDALGYKLLPVSDLYNEYAAQLNLYDICLMIIETCKQQNHDEISKCWKLIIFEEILPCRTRSPIAFDYLNELRDGIVQDEIIFGETKDESVNEFDDGSWVPRLVVRVTELGKKLYGKDANFTFPVPLLLEVLEDLRQAHMYACSGDVHHWPTKVMLDVGVPYGEILDVYDMRRVHGSGVVVVEAEDSTSRLHNFACISEVLQLWIDAALSDNDFRGNEMGHNASYQLARAKTQGLVLRIDSLRTDLEEMVEANRDLGELIHSRLTDARDTILRNF